MARFLRYTGILYGLSLLLQLPLHNVIWPVRTCWQAVCGSVFLCLATRLWQSRRWYVALVLVTLLSVAAGYIPWWDRHVVSGSAVVSALVTGLSYFCAYSILRAVLHRRVRTPWGRRAGEVALFLGYTILGLLPPLVVLGYYGLSGHFFSVEIVLAIFQTTPREAWEYARTTGLFGWVLLACIAVSVPTGLYFLMGREKFVPWRGKSLAVFLVAFVAAVLCLQNATKPLYARVLYRESKTALGEYAKYQQGLQDRQAKLRSLHGLSTNAEPGLYVLVIGESTSRNHMHAYGYHRETTPWLDRATKQDGTLLFTKAYSNHTHTVPVLTYALSQKNQYDRRSLPDAYSIMEVAKTAGFRTLWVSSQNTLGPFDTPVATIASTADKTVWINGAATISRYDQALLPALRQLPLDAPGHTLLVVHLMGAHGDYTERYPREEEVFHGGPSRNVDQYDNAVRYNDRILGEIYGMVARQPGFQALVYLSDHGEDPDRGVSHEYTKFTWPMTHIPFVMPASPSFRRTDAYRTLRNRRDAPWTNDLLYDLLLTVLDIRGMIDRDSRFDLASPAYDCPAERLRTGHGQKCLLDDPALQAAGK